ncbi:MAG: hypothetical protein IPK06_02260 [Ignavibacteriae bacterium]|nr:hypothetical protein [Ignavibacteriota bacterium]
MGFFTISDATEWYSGRGGGIIFNFTKWLDSTLRMRYEHKKANGVIATSKFLNHYYKKNKCNVIEVPTIFDNKSLMKIQKTENNNDKKIRFLYAGSPFTIKRIDKKRKSIKDRLDKIISLFYRISNNHKNFILNIYGITKENYLSVYTEHEDILNNLANNIIFNGRKCHDEILKEIKNHDFTIFLRESDRVTEAVFPTK